MVMNFPYILFSFFLIKQDSEIFYYLWSLLLIIVVEYYTLPEHLSSPPVF
jgi:hypothetical protein